MAKTTSIFAKLPPLRGLLPLILFLIAWQLLQPRQSPYFPPPSAWWTSVLTLLRDGRLMPALGSTLLTFGAGLSAATLCGGAIGLLIGLSRRASRTLGPLLEFCRSLPPPVVVPMAVLLLGYSQSLKLLVVTWAAAWPILLNTASATSQIEPLLLSVARTYRLTSTDTVRKIVIPAVLPAFMLGMRVAVPLAIIVTLLVEMLTLMPGVGSLIVTAQREYHSAEVYGLLVLIGLLGFVLNNAFIVIEAKLLRRWPPRAHEIT
ncbi:MAG TPA: ABC transporter permease subunit [Candidatus Binataceae bacterium]|nr:ABC transporter permease subunit [Candidatus Binataceae bacterium]